MTTGTQSDFLVRLKTTLPGKWFGDVTPALDAILGGISNTWASLYAFFSFIGQQSRIATATGPFLDGAATDFFGFNLLRFAGEAYAALSARILATFFQPQGTRSAVTANLVALTGRAPTIFEPANPSDTGGYGFQGMTQGTGLGYGLAGGYGSLALPFQAFVTAYRRTGGGVANVAGYYVGSGWAGGGYGVGAIEYASLSLVLGAITDAAILNTINTTRPVASIAWTRLSA